MTHEIQCPHCHKSFTIDEAGYANIAEQVRTKEFEQAINERSLQMEEQHQSKIELAKKDVEARMQEKVAEQLRIVAELRAKIDAVEKEKAFAVEKALSDKEKEVVYLENKVAGFEKEKELIQVETQKKLQERISEKENKITELVAKVASFEQEKELVKAETENKLNERISEKERKLFELELEKKSLKENYEIQLRLKEEEIEKTRDFKQKLSTKMLGETLEQHCEIAFESLRMAAFQNATFGKDNDIATGSKGDYIYREQDAKSGAEILSIMFEMKTENDETATKKKNKDFLKELDKDRIQKKCEYAILVSTLESDNDLYNNGIVDVSYEYEKMYVIRPQFFIPIITLLRNAALKSLDYKRKIALMENQNIDITNFESEMNAFKTNFATTAKNFNGNLEKLDKNLEDSIKKLTTARDELRKAMKNLGTAENKLDGLSVKRLTKDNPTMREKFDMLEG